jgi:hypothetical protein
MESGSERLYQKAGARFRWSDGLILLAAAALAVVLLAVRRVAPNGQYIVFWALFVCALVLIGVKHILASMRRPHLAFACCLLGGILCGALFLALAWSYFITHPVKGQGDGAWAGGILYLLGVMVAPIAGFVVGFPVTLAICAWIQSMGTEPKPSGTRSGLE